METGRQIKRTIASLAEAYQDFGPDTDEDAYELAEEEVLADCTDEEIAAYNKHVAHSAGVI